MLVLLNYKIKVLNVRCWELQFESILLHNYINSIKFYSVYNTLISSVTQSTDVQGNHCYLCP